MRRRPANLSPQIPTLANKNKLMLKAIACGILLQNNVSQMGSLATTVENRWVLGSRKAKNILQRSTSLCQICGFRSELERSRVPGLQEPWAPGYKLRTRGSEKRSAVFVPLLRFQLDPLLLRARRQGPTTAEHGFGGPSATKLSPFHSQGFAQPSLCIQRSTPFSFKTKSFK